MSILKNVAKNGIIMFGVGALLALAAPMIGSLAGFSELPAMTLSSMWTGAYFAGFGMLSALITPVIDHAFGESPAQANSEPAPQKPQIVIQLGQTPELKQAREVIEARYAEAIKAERSVTQRVQLQ